MSERFYITTAIPYANGAPHIGHAYERIATDAIQRFMRLDGRDDSVRHRHGRIRPEGAADRRARGRVAAGIRRRRRGEIRGDGRGAERPRRRHRAHHAAAPRPLGPGDLASGWRPTATSICRNIPAGTRCATRPISARTSSPTARTGQSSRPAARRCEWVEEESYFFRLSAYAEKLLAHYEANPDFVTPEKYRNEIVAFVKRGLSDLSISRTDVQLGRAGARRSQARDVCLGRRADQLHHRDRFPRRRPARKILAGRRACDRQGHHALPRRSTGRRS